MKNLRWIPITGKSEFKNNILKYIPDEQVGVSLNSSPRSSAIVKSNQYFENGTITFSAYLNEPSSRCHVILGQNSVTPIGIGLNIGFHSYGVGMWDQQQWKDLSVAGGNLSVPVKEWVSVKITVSGSLISLMINEVELCRTQAYIQQDQLALFFDGADEVRVKDFKVSAHKPSVFTVMQFSDQYDELYNEVIKPTSEDFNLECIRADDMYTNGLIIEDISRSIREAYIVIADVTPDNPNVYYEVGYAHGIGKPVILLCDRKREKLPFDVSGMRTIFYDNSIAGKSVVEERLRKHLENITKSLTSHVSLF